MKIHLWLASITMSALLAGCAHQPVDVKPEVPLTPVEQLGNAEPPVESRMKPVESSGLATMASASERSSPSKIYRGTGRFIDSSVAKLQPVNRLKNGDVTLNFESAEVREVVDVILRDLLNENYVVDPAVTGNVSLQTSRGIARESLPYVLENLLQLNGAALIQEGSLYRIVPLGTAATSNLQPSLSHVQNQNIAGYRIQIVPLRYISAKEMESILTPVMREGGILRVDDKRNLLLLGGTSLELQGWMQTINIFDVNWLKGQSVGLFALDYADADTVTRELRKILGAREKPGMTDMIRVEPMTRLNAVMVISPQANYVSEMRQWVERLDTISSEPGTRLFVYHVKHRKAAELSSLVQKIFSSERGVSAYDDGITAQNDQPLSLAPGLNPVTLESDKTGKAVENVTQPAIQMPSSELAIPSSGNVSIVADENNNSILVMATASDYRAIEGAFKRLDVRPLQVLIEASIVEVTLTDDLRFGLEWFFKNSGIDSDKRGVGTLDLGNGLSQVVPGFSYSVIDAAGMVRGVLNTLASESKLNVLSSPSLMVLDNRTATIRIGDQQPVKTASSLSGNDIITEKIEYKDTGVLLTVTPQVNSGGLVTMDISQEVTDVGNIDPATGQRSFLQRNIGSTVAIQDGQTIVLGGLITENTSKSESGIPILYKIPLLGKLFGQTATATLRRELVVLITPKVVENTSRAVQITNEFKQRLTNIEQRSVDGTSAVVNN